ncbi:MAG: helix-turn-helix domain-containing protein [Bacteroidia bacterium]
MKTTVNERIKELIKHFEINDRQFALKTGIPNTTLSTYLKRGTDPGSNSISLILKAFPNVSAQWLLLGVGEMINENEVQLPGGAIQIAHSINGFTEMLNKITEQSAENALLKERLRVLEEKKTDYDMVASPVAKYGEK